MPSLQKSCWGQQPGSLLPQRLHLHTNSTGILQELTPPKPQHAFPRRERQRKAQAAKRRIPVRGWVVHGRAFSGEIEATQVSQEHRGGMPSTAGARAPSSHTGRAVAGAAQPSLRCWSTPGTMLVRARRGHVWGMGKLGANADPSHPHPPKSPQIQRETRSASSSRAVCPHDLNEASH